MAESFDELKLPVSVNEGTRVIIVGKTGSGKSTLGNILLQHEDVYADDAPDSDQTGFVVATSFRSETSKCDYGIAENAWGRNIKVVDTPGLFDTRENLGKTLTELTNVMSLSSPGPHAILFVTRCDIKFTNEENETFEKIVETFQEKSIKDFLILVFTHGEFLKRATIEQMLANAPESLKNVMGIVGTNYAVISQTENASKRRQEVENLLSKIDWVSKSGESYYVNNDMEKMTKILVEEIEKIMKERNVNWREAEFFVKKGLAMEKAERWKEVKKKLLIIAVASPIFAVLIGLTGGLAAVGIAGATTAEAVAAGSTAGVVAYLASIIVQLETALKEKKKATGKCAIS